ncbi:hypothetical protein MKX41_21295 [Paenibacillus sp. FSL R5-0475]|uniref:hypothetical protein n=1 Tax=Paenibacillus sp. FSL R5-0475 TaxID=2921643 RepID=UPI0030F5192E
MKLQIESWAEKTNAFEGIGFDLFKESVACYKIGAYRSAFLMSYLALMQTIKQRVLNFNSKPEHVEERKWRNFREELEKDRNWEEAVMNIIMMSKPKFIKATKMYELDGRIIRLSNHDEVIDEFKKWRHTRNQTAHAKVGTINSATVECFWNFIQDNLFKFHVNGGLEYYKEAIFKSYRDQYERVTITFKEHLNALPTAELNKEELISLWRHLRSNIANLQAINNENLILLWNEILYHSNPLIKSSFIDFVKSSPSIFIRFYSLIPEVLSIILGQTEGHLFKKDTLYTWIKEEINHYENRVFWKLVTEIIERYTPKEDLFNFYEHINILDIRILPNDLETDILKRNSFFDSKEDRLCSYLIYSYNDAPDQLRNIEIIYYLLKHMTLNPRIVRVLNSFVDGLANHDYPIVNQLYYSIRDFIEGDRLLASKVKSIASENQIVLSESLSRFIATALEDGTTSI